MKLKKVHFLPERIAVQIKPEPNWACISITLPDMKADLKEGWSSLLRLQFHDIGGNYENEADKDLVRMSDEQADSVIDFLDKISTDETTEYLIVHCQDGISRSAAVALFAHEYYTEFRYDLLGTGRHNQFVRHKLECAYHRKYDE